MNEEPSREHLHVHYQDENKIGIQTSVTKYLPAPAGCQQDSNTGPISAFTLDAIQEEGICSDCPSSKACNIGEMTSGQVPVLSVSHAEDMITVASHGRISVMAAPDTGDLTDVDVFEVSDPGEEEDGHVSPGLRLSSFAEFETTFHEKLTLDNGNPPNAEFNPGSNQYLGVNNDEEEGAHTDVEDIEDADGGFEFEEVEYTAEDLWIIDAILGEEGIVDITDEMKRSMSGTPSPAITPEPKASIKNKGKLSKSQKKGCKKKFLSPTADYGKFLNSADATKLSSASGVSTQRSKLNRIRPRRSKSPRASAQSLISESLTDVEDLDLSAPEDSRAETEVQDPFLTVPLYSRVSISQESYVTTTDYVGPDTEAEDITFSDNEDGKVPNKIVYSTRGSSLSPSVDCVESVTDCEELYMEEEAKALQNMDSFCSSIAVAYGTKDVRERGGAYDSSCTSSDEDIVVSAKCDTKPKVPKITLIEADGGPCYEDEYSIDLSWTLDSRVRTEDCLTDREDLKLSDSESESRKSSITSNLRVSFNDAGALTDTEMYEDDEPLRPKTPEPEDVDVTDERLPAPTRELTLLKETDEGHPESVVLPLGDAQPQGLFLPADETSGVTDIEDFQGESGDDDVSYCKSPDIPDLEGGTVESSDSVKTQKKRSKPLHAAGDYVDALTDTEDVYFSGSCGRKKKSKARGGIKTKSSILSVDPSHFGISDVEEIEVSDLDTPLIVSGNMSPSQHFLNVSQPEDDKTDIEDISGLSGAEEDSNGEVTDGHITPDCLRNLGGEVVTSIDGDGPFTIEQKLDFNSHAKFRKRFSSGILATPDNMMQTDVEDDFVTSADEENIRSARVSIDAEHSVVLDTITRKINLDEPEEAQYVKGTLIRDVHTDVEDVGLSEEEITGRIAVIDGSQDVCVCITSRQAGALNSSVCVCVARDVDRLELVMGMDNSTSSTSAEGSFSSQAMIPTILCEPRHDCLRVPLVLASSDETVAASAPLESEKKYFSYLEPTKLIYRFSVVQIARGFSTNLNVYPAKSCSAIEVDCSLVSRPPTTLMTCIDFGDTSIYEMVGTSPFYWSLPGVRRGLVPQLVNCFEKIALRQYAKTSRSTSISDVWSILNSDASRPIQTSQRRYARKLQV